MKRTGLARVLILLTALFCGTARAEVTADVLLRVLVRKGVLTEAEAAEVRAEAERETAPGPSAQVPPSPAASTRISGYLQARAVTGNRDNDLLVKRARLTVRHATSMARYQLTLDAGRNDLAVIEAFAAYIRPARDPKIEPLAVRFGQHLRSFGIELERSSSAREFPEMPAGWSALFPGAADVGISATGGIGPGATATLAMVNGSGAGRRGLPPGDTDNYKDVLARLRHTISAKGGTKFDVALSAYAGRQRVPGVPAAPAQTGCADRNANSLQDADEPTVILTPERAALPAITGDRSRLGLSVWASGIFDSEVRAEYISARDLTVNLGPGPRMKTARAEAWYLMALRPVGSGVSLGARYDVFDPDVDDVARPDGDGEIRTLGFLALREFTPNLRLTAAYERPRTTRHDPDAPHARTEARDVWTLQGQYKF